MNRDDDNTRTHVALTKGTMVSHYRIIEPVDKYQDENISDLAISRKEYV